ncbi:MAG: NAD(P)/FAD-dependent oxidoreductase [Chlamydiales bacterium]
MYDLIVIGGGAGGVFGAISAKAANPHAKVLLLEKSGVLLSKVKISGGGRCNVTHGCFEPKMLTERYPRGSKELIGPFHRFQPRNTIEWFESRGVNIKIEEDGRAFPVTDRSQTIIDTLLQEASKLGVEILLRQKINVVSKNDKEFLIERLEGESLTSTHLLLATGSSPEGWKWAEEFGHTINPPVPSLFTFNSPSSSLKELSGISVDPTEVNVLGTARVERGPLLITHFGFSGPAVLKLSAWEARHLHTCDYRFKISINWLPNYSSSQICAELMHAKTDSPAKPLSERLFGLPKNLWRALLQEKCDKRANDLTAKELQLLAHRLHADIYSIEGKTTHKEEFVTCGGVKLSEIDFKTMESKITPGLFFAGEILDIDGITGGFNFQNAWTSAYIAGSALQKIK